MEPTLKKSIVEYIIGKRNQLVLVGNPITLSIVYEAARTSKNLLEALRNGELDRVSHALNEKRIAVSRYESVIGSSWDL